MKTTKLSLAAVLSIMTITTASAGSLEEAVKNTDISGSAAYRYNDYEGSEPNNNYKIATTIKSKINDDFTFNSRLIVGDGTTNPVSLTTSSADSEAQISLSEANFSYSGINNAVVTVGKQGVATPFTVARDAMGAETTGTGVLATYNVSNVTLAGGFFNQTNMPAAGKDIYTVGLMGNFAGISADAWYIDVDETASAYTIGANASYDLSSVKVNPALRYSKADNDANDDKISTLKAELSLSAGIFDAYLAYGKSGENGAVALDGNSSDTTLDPHWRVGLIDQADSEAIFANIGAKVLKNVHVSLKHSNLDAEAVNGDREETYGQVVYNVSPNFLTFVRFGEYKEENSEATKAGRLHIQYNF